MSKRAHIPMIEKAAALVAALFEIPYDHRKLMDAEQVLSLVHFDHDPIPHVHGGADKHFNLTPLLIVAHREKTAGVDVPQIAKTARIERAQKIHTAKMLMKGDPYVNKDAVCEALAELVIDKFRVVPKPRKKHRWPKGRKLQSRPFNSKRKRSCQAR